MGSVDNFWSTTPASTATTCCERIVDGISGSQRQLKLATQACAKASTDNDEGALGPDRKNILERCPVPPATTVKAD